ncbi:hypothetical protein [Nonomuraea rubra]
MTLLVEAARAACSTARPDTGRRARLGISGAMTAVLAPIALRLYSRRS